MTEGSIEWNGLSLADWEVRFNAIRRTNILQSYTYAQAASAINRQRPRWGLIRMDGQEAGLVQIFEAGFMGLHAVILDRGPLWFQDYGAPDHLVAFFAAFDKDFPHRWGRRRRIIPEMEKTQAMMIPYREVTGIKPYQTIWMDLTQDENILREGLKRNWRNHLNKGEREKIKIVWDDKGAGLSWLLAHNEAHRTIKNFQAASPKFIRALANACTPRGDMLVGQAFIGDDAVAAVLFFRHGRSATYQVGWSGDAGRRVNAHQLLLWQGMMQLKSRGVLDLDLGGINDVAEGIRAFKEGMGGETVTLCGMYS